MGSSPTVPAPIPAREPATSCTPQAQSAVLDADIGGYESANVLSAEGRLAPSRTPPLVRGVTTLGAAQAAPFSKVTTHDITTATIKNRFGKTACYLYPKP